MVEVSKESVIENITEMLSENDPEIRLRMIEEINTILQRELLKTSIDVPEMSCHVCGCTECIRYGRTRTGTQRCMCKSCDMVGCHRDTSGVLANTKLDMAV